ncbi:MAG: heavy metal translocating P-type ATPase [Deltaproteobacteria bacterium]|jgi:Cu2+-exporting ATPase|nr:heavy metal translocating P-type ATPase [Deltaproteobacteria bacterium]
MSAATAPAGAVEACFHCGLAVPAGSSYSVVVDGVERPMCCPGCRAVAMAIIDQGLDDYYRHREGHGVNPEAFSPISAEESRSFDDEEIQRGFTRCDPDGIKRATLSIEGISCAACAWLIERQLRRRPGVIDVSVHLGSHRAQLAWDPSKAKLSELLAAVTEVGYLAHPFQPDREEQYARDQQRRMLRRLGVAGLGMMQVMMYAVGLYAGSFQGIDDRYRLLLHWVSLIVTTPVVFYAASPFFTNALRDLRSRQLGMDVPVAIAIGGAYLASVGSMWRGAGEVYFDSVCMFTFFLLLGRYLEARMRRRSDEFSRRLLRGAPRTARRIGPTGEEIVACRLLVPGDWIRVREGEVIPADGVIVEGRSAVDEALLTGEPLPHPRLPGDPVIGGSQNIESPLVISVTRTGANSTLASIVALLDRAQAERPATVRAADRAARIFVAVVLGLTAAVTFYWWHAQPDRAFAIGLALLVSTCPCALSLATPAALAAATNGLARTGLLVSRGHVLEGLARISDFVFDKTGTLTRGELELVAVRPLGAESESECVEIARALEEHSSHPIARAFARWSGPEMRREDGSSPAPKTFCSETATSTGSGLSGRIRGVEYRIGRADWALSLIPGGSVPTFDEADCAVLLVGERAPLAWFGFRDELRPGAARLIERLRRRGVRPHLLTGDPSPGATRVADRLGIERARGGASPAEKLAYVRDLQASGAVIAMAGDGVNDAPVLAAAQISIAMGGGSDLTRSRADSVLLEDDLDALGDAVAWSHKTRRVIRQNLAWALLYNLTILPLAGMGWVAPYAAAIGMSLSSLLVVGNALRLGDVRVSK